MLAAHRRPRGERRASAPIDVRPARGVRRLESDDRICLAITAAARSGRTRSPPSCRRRRLPACASPARAAGRFSLAEALADGARLGATARRDCGFAAPTIAVPARPAKTRRGSRRSGTSRGRGQRRSSIFRTTSPTATSSSPRAKAFASVEHLKRYTTLGMATDQGKTASLTGLAHHGRADRQDDRRDRRPMFRGRLTCRWRSARSPAIIAAGISVPCGCTAEASMGERAGRRLRRSRPVAARAMVLRDPARPIGWQTVNREVIAVRAAASASATSRRSARSTSRARTPAACSIASTSTPSRHLPVGKARYGVMLREDGFVMDDGTTSRLGRRPFLHDHDDRQCGQGHAALEFCRQVLWPELDVQIASVTEQWAQISVAGPRSRELLRAAARCRISRTSAFPIWPPPSSRWRRARAAVSPLLLRRTGL